ncbi:hypothetical protein CSB11_00905 [Candidatus Campbellbacteria bacterium]|nr:MAG: hypothetical protein CSB11_00905 [Candidatus Campbellbacteria bacterium]
MNNKMNNNFEPQSDDSKIDELKDFLYSRKTGEVKPQRSTLKKREKIDLNVNWGKEKETEETKKNKEEEFYQYKIRRKNSIFYIALILSFLFFVGALAFTFFFVSFSKNEISLSDIEISVIGPNSVKSGEDLPFSVVIDNPSDIVYEDIDLTLTYPASTVKTLEKEFVKTENRQIKKKLKAKGKLVEQFNVILSGNIGEKKDIGIEIFYKGENYSGVLNKQSNYTVEIDSSPVAIELSYPRKVNSSEEFNIDINVLSNVTDTVYDLILVGKYPIGFEVISTNPEPWFVETMENVFKIDEIKPGEKKSIKIKGILKGELGEEKYFNFAIGDTFDFKNEMRTLFAEKQDKITIKKPDINFALVTNEDNEYKDAIYSAGDIVGLDFILENNLSNPISNIKVTADIVGDIYDPISARSQRGFFDSNKSRFTWDKNLSNSFKFLAGKKQIKEKINFSLFDFDKILKNYIKDPEIKLDFKIYGNSLESAEAKSEIYAEFEKKIKLRTNLFFSEKVLYSEGPFENTGEPDPVVGEKTTYTIAWEIKNSSSDVENIKISAKIPYYVKYLDKTSPNGSYFKYNKETRILTLDYKKIDAFTGYKNESKVAYFQVAYNPTAPHVGTSPILIGEKKVIGLDKFTNEKIVLNYNYSTIETKDGSVVTKK